MGLKVVRDTKHSVQRLHPPWVDDDGDAMPSWWWRGRRRETPNVTPRPFGALPCLGYRQVNCPERPRCGLTVDPLW